NRMTGQIDELLDATRIQLGQPLTLQRQPLDLVNLVRQVVAELANGNQAHRILVEAPLPSLDCAVDGARLERVLDNLLSTAAKFSADGGDIVVEVRNEADAAGSWAVVAVRDQGIGIPAADLPRIFEMFHRAG